MPSVATVPDGAAALRAQPRLSGHQRRPCNVAAVLASVVPALDLAFGAELETDLEEVFGPLLARLLARPLGEFAPTPQAIALEAA